MIVDQIYGVLKTVEEKTYRSFPHITPFLPEKITYLHAEELLAACPDMSPKDREYEAAKKYGAIFIIGIGATLSNGEKHDGRAPDYDDWSTPTVDGHRGLNGDIILWNPSMGSRVDREAMLRQLELENCMERRSLAFHRALLNGEIPLSIGGGIGQSRLCMYFLRCAHIGEVQASLWSDEMIEQCRANHIILK